jgi:hypothetical protein
VQPAEQCHGPSHAENDDGIGGVPPARVIVKIVVHAQVDVLRGHGGGGRDGRHVKAEIEAHEAVGEVACQSVEGTGHDLTGFFTRLLIWLAIWLVGGQGRPGEREARQHGKDVSGRHRLDGDPRPPRRLVPANRRR